MSTIIFVVSLLWPAPGPMSGLEVVADSVNTDGPLRYRGIERLLAQFEAQSVASTSARVPTQNR